METAETILSSWMSRVWTQGETAAIDQLLAPDAPVHGLGPNPLVGPEGFRPFHRAFSAAFTEIQIDIVDQVVDGDRVAGRWSGSMVHKASGTPVPTMGMAIVTCGNGQIQEGWNSADFLPMLISLGIVPFDAVEQALG